MVSSGAPGLTTQREPSDPAVQPRRVVNHGAWPGLWPAAFSAGPRVGKMRPPNVNEATSPLVVLSAKTHSDLTPNFPVDKPM